jgi:alkanesulfonate monooxygenase SsuD/methylene tetrahydromethanopterin reductase-like flavin-dependent oxidoreductase (luciferase family)
VRPRRFRRLAAHGNNTRRGLGPCNAPAAGKERPTGHGTPAEVAADMLRYREAAGLDAFQINFHGNRDVDQLLQSMECFMREVKSRLA